MEKYCKLFKTTTKPNKTKQKRSKLETMKKFMCLGTLYRYLCDIYINNKPTATHQPLIARQKTKTKQI